MANHMMLQKSLESPFTSLPANSICEILSTSPLDVVRFAVTSRGLKAASDYDTLWKRFVPMEIVSRSAYPVIMAPRRSLTSVCVILQLDGGKLILRGGSVYTYTSWGETCDLHLLKISSQMLSPNTTYVVYLVFGLKDGFWRPLCEAIKLYPRQTERYSRKRDDGWMEMEIGEFDNDKGDDELREWLRCYVRFDAASGAMVEGIEFLPKSKD